MERPAYIGITDFTNRNQVLDLMRLFAYPEYAHLKRKFMIGVMMSYKTLNGIPTKTGWENIWARKEELHKLFLNLPHLMNTIHYADREGIEIFKSLMKARQYGGANLHAIQLDMTWPDYASVIKFKEKNPDIQIVLQVGKEAFSQAGHDSLLIAKRLGGYHGAVDYVLLDRSMGTGKPLISEDFLPLLRILRAELPDLGLACAGGLSFKTVSLIESIAKEFPFISVDAQGKLRPSGDMAKPIDWELARKYVLAMLNLLNNLK